MGGTISNFIEGDMNYGKFGDIMDLLFKMEISKGVVIPNFKKTGKVQFQGKILQYEFSALRLNIFLKRLEIEDPRLILYIDEFCPGKGQEEILLSGDNVKNVKTSEEHSV